jgi:hypothetical protein
MWSWHANCGQCFNLTENVAVWDGELLIWKFSQLTQTVSNSKCNVKKMSHKYTQTQPNTFHTAVWRIVTFPQTLSHHSTDFSVPDFLALLLSSASQISTRNFNSKSIAKNNFIFWKWVSLWSTKRRAKSRWFHVAEQKNNFKTTFNHFFAIDEMKFKKTQR